MHLGINCSWKDPVCSAARRGEERRGEERGRAIDRSRSDCGGFSEQSWFKLEDRVLSKLTHKTRKGTVINCDSKSPDGWGVDVRHRRETGHTRAQENGALHFPDNTRFTPVSPQLSFLQSYLLWEFFFASVKPKTSWRVSTASLNKEGIEIFIGAHMGMY